MKEKNSTQTSFQFNQEQNKRGAVSWAGWLVHGEALHYQRRKQIQFSVQLIKIVKEQLSTFSWKSAYRLNFINAYCSRNYMKSCRSLNSTASFFDPKFPLQVSHIYWNKTIVLEFEWKEIQKIMWISFTEINRDDISKVNNSANKGSHVQLLTFLRLV